MQKIELTLPVGEVTTFEKLCKRASKNIDGISWKVGEMYKKTYRHYCDGEIEKWLHQVVNVVLEIPEVNNWVLLATVVEGNLFVQDKKNKLVLHNGHGKDYQLCDSCKHRQWKKSFIVKNTDTEEELQIGSECAKKFGIGTMNAIYNLTKELYESYSMYSSEYDGLEPISWPSHHSDPSAVRSEETTIVIQAAKSYYDEHNGVWKKGGYVGGTYYPSESAAKIREILKDFKADDNNTYINALKCWINEEFKADEYNDFDQSIKSIGTNYYISVSDVSAAFFAIKKYEQWRKENEAREKGLFIPKRGDYIHIVGKVVNKTIRNGYFGDYVEYEILNTLDGNTYKRAGVVKCDEDNNVNCYAYIKNVWQGNYTLERTTLKPKKGENISNEN